jgi:hypothetical protein
MTAQIIAHPAGRAPALTLVVPWFNEEAVLPETAARFKDLLDSLAVEGLIDTLSTVMFIDDGSRHRIWVNIKEQCLDSFPLAVLGNV